MFLDVFRFDFKDYTILMYRIYQIGIKILVVLCTCINNINLGTFIKVSRIYIFLYL